jgi:membrane protease YdiL (CAAX protease family)
MSTAARGTGFMRETTTAVLAAPVYLFLFWCALRVPLWIGLRPGGFVPPSAPTHAAMLVASLALGAGLFPDWRRTLGLTLGTYRFSPWILLWVLPTAALATASVLGSPPGPARSPMDATPLQAILFVWIVASCCEELFARGLLQGMLAGWSGHGVRLFGRVRIGLPAWVSGLLFGLSHLVLWPMLGPMAIPIAVSASLLGIVAGYYRQETGSVLPAILVHALFNIGGTVPLWAFSA